MRWPAHATLVRLWLRLRYPGNTLFSRHRHVFSTLQYYVLVFQYFIKVPRVEIDTRCVWVPYFIFDMFFFFYKNCIKAKYILRETHKTGNDVIEWTCCIKPSFWLHNIYFFIKYFVFYFYVIYKKMYLQSYKYKKKFILGYWRHYR